MNNRSEENLRNNERVPRWLMDALEARRLVACHDVADRKPTAASDSFHSRCREKASVTFALAKARRQHVSTGFVPMGMLEYLGEIAAMACVALGQMLRFTPDVGGETIRWGGLRDC